MTVNHPHPLISQPPAESRNAMESRNYNRSSVQYESTAEGDVVVVEPSFDAEENAGGDPSTSSKPIDEGGSGSKPQHDGSKRSHTRNLSEHFFDATTLSGAQETTSSKVNEDDGRYEYKGGPRGYRAPPPELLPEIGKKHRRVFSGDVSNPREAHRRINSVGKSEPIQRRSYGQERQHQRVDSLGLDVLTAAADVSREELAAAAGGGAERDKGASSRHPWGATSEHARGSPVEMITYDHSSRGMPPPPQGIPAPPPPPRAPYAPAPPGHSHASYYPGSHAYPQAPYPPPHYRYPYHPGHGPPPSHPPSSYPVQYARGPDPYAKHPARQPTKPEMESSGPAMDSYNHKKSTETGPPSVRRDRSPRTPPAPVPSSHWRGGATTQGSQTAITTIGAGEAGRVVHPSYYGAPSEGGEAAYHDGHHRKTSSVGWVPPGLYPGAEPGAAAYDHPLKGGPPGAHHRATSSNVSFLQCFDVGLDNQDAAFLKNLQASAESPSKAFLGPQGGADLGKPGSAAPTQNPATKLAPGGTSKRVRRKCTVDGCSNRVVQGGLCISHGAKRKQCKHPGCTKNVKKAGLCSTHGPARKRCDAEGCTKVAVQGGKCIAHGAKKKLCSIENCTKQAILGGMCKKHHDSSKNAAGSVAPAPPKKASNNKSADSSATKKQIHKPKHTRGLSIFQEISADTVGNLLDTTTPPAEGNSSAESPNPPPDSGHRHQSTFSRDFANLYP